MPLPKSEKEYHSSSLPEYAVEKYPLSNNFLALNIGYCIQMLASVIWFA